MSDEENEARETQRHIFSIFWASLSHFRLPFNHKHPSIHVHLWGRTQAHRLGGAVSFFEQVAPSATSSQMGKKQIINLLLSTLRKLNYIFSFGSCATATINATWRTARRNRVKQSIINHTATSQRHPNEVWRWRCIRRDSLIMCHSTALYWAMVVLSSFGDGWEGKA